MLDSQTKGMRDLETLREYGCRYRFIDYIPHLSELIFLASISDLKGPRYRITFQTTLYIQTVTDWFHGGFELAGPEKYTELVDALDLNTAAKEQLLLFVASPLNKPEVLVLCHTVYVSQETPLP